MRVSADEGNICMNLKTQLHVKSDNSVRGIIHLLPSVSLSLSPIISAISLNFLRYIISREDVVMDPISSMLQWPMPKNVRHDGGFGSNRLLQKRGD